MGESGALLFLAGVVGLLVVGVDVVATTTGSGSRSGSGPLTARLSKRLWAVALAVHRRRPSHRALHVFGLTLTVGVVTAWILAAWSCWTLVFASVDGSVVSSTTREPVGLAGKAYFAGYSILTLGNGEVQPSSTPWRILTLAASASGLALVTLAVTYVLNVVQAGNRRRSLATLIWSLGDTSDEIVERARRDPDRFASQVWSLVDPLALVREQHVAFPVLHYLHATDRHRALPAQAAKLARAVERLRSEGGPASSSVLQSAARVLDEYAVAVAAYEPDGPDRTGGMDVERLLEGAGWSDPDP